MKNKKKSIKKCMVGVGLRSTHYPYLENLPQTQIDWFEALSENYMDTFGRPREILNLIRSNYPVALHGVSMSLASAEGLDKGYLLRLKKLIAEIDPFIVSDHLCWTGLKDNKLHDLLPFPYNKENIEIVLKNIDVAQNTLGRNLVIENVSSYMKFSQSESTEFEFLAEIAKRSGAKILLDINNVYVSAINLNLDPKKCIDAISPDLVGQIHLAGFTDMQDFLFDTHSKPVYPQVWELFSYFIQNAPNVPFMIEWDEDVPEFSKLQEEALKAKKIWNEHHDK